MPTLRLTDSQFSNIIRDLFEGAIATPDSFPSSSDLDDYTSNPDANVVSLLVAEDILRSAEDIGAQFADNITQFLPCAGAAADSACARSFVADFGRRAFRRPLRNEEISDIMGLFEQVRADTPFEASMGIVVTAMLQMPQFLYMLELGTRTETPGIIALSNHEIAQRLGLLFLDSIPDAALMTAADNGELSDPAQLEAHARRLLDDPRSTPALAKFFGEWLKVEPVDPFDKDATIFSALDTTLASSMNREFSEFIELVFRDLDGGLNTLLTTRTTRVNRPLAEFYGLDPTVSTSEEDWVQVELPANERSGILTRPGLLATHAHQILTAPVFRGKLIRTQMLCGDIPNPPADAMARAPEFPEGASPRLRSEILRSVEECASCHRLMDPIGLGFENYDAIGAYRIAYRGGETVDNSGEVINGGELGTFAGINELSIRLATAEVVQECVPRQLYRFMYGRREGARDTCALQAATSAFDNSGQDLRELFVSMVLIDTFAYRTTPETGDAR